ncbi:MAG: NAD(P)H-dependent glycerol-3-phosphate dehydrogenase [Leptothrix sp. (in: b-proteobacteria)]
MTRISVLGAGAWGTALAAQAATRHPTCLWARDAAQAAAIASSHSNQRYLPDIALPEALQLTADFDAALAHAAGSGTEADAADQNGLIIIATPMAALRDMLQRLAAAPAAQQVGVLWLCKGFEAGTGRLGHEIAREVSPNLRTGVLSGPSFAQEVARGQPTALVAASTDESVCQLAIEALHSQSLRIYSSADPVGVEVGGAVKNVLAIATGVADGMQLGLNARAALITRGLAEMTRLGLALGAQLDTFMGLSGLGDLVLTATGDLSRNRRVGLRLADGLPLARILEELGHVAEGVYSARTVLSRAQALGVEMPITHAVVTLLAGKLAAPATVQALMQREARAES